MRIYSKPEEFFDAEEKETLKTVIHDVESRTTGEIVIMVVDHSDRYIEAEIIAGVLLASILSLILTVGFFHSSIWSYIPISFLFFFPCRFLFIRAEVLKKPFIGNRRLQEAVKVRAERTFFERGLNKTRKSTGVLFFLSLLERRVWVLADKGIYTRMDQGTLNRFAHEVSGGIKQGRACDALSQAIREIGALLSQHFPITPEDTNELSNDVVTER